jgi:hypothetical protein
MTLGEKIYLLQLYHYARLPYFLVFYSPLPFSPDPTVEVFKLPLLTFQLTGLVWFGGGGGVRVQTIR